MSYLPAYDERTLIIAAHPDDEVIGLGAALPRFREVMIVHVTDGSPLDLRDALANGFDSRETYACARRNELESALSVGRVQARLHCLNIVDQQASSELSRVRKEIGKIVDSYRPEIVWTHPYEGGHPDHDACACAVHSVLRPTGVPVAEFTSYHAGPDGIVIGEFLKGEQHVYTHDLSPEERDLKTRMLACFTTQHETLSQFRVDVERYRWAPEYDFSAPPHNGPLYPWVSPPVQRLSEAS